MTREEARFKLLAATESRCTESFITDFLDSIEALGLLKFDSERGPNERAVDAMFGYGSGGVITPRHAVEAIEKVGLKIVSA